MLTKQKITSLLSEKTSISQKETKVIVDKFFSSILDCLIAGDEVQIKNFGKFSLKTKKSRIGRNPKTLKEATIAKRSIIAFSPSKSIKASIQMNAKIEQDTK